MTNYKIKIFTDLITWKKAHSLTLLIYKETKTFPKEERYSLTDQIRRASVSVSSNIAEGFGRLSKKEKVHFYYIAKGSLAEVQNQLFIARDIGYLTGEKCKMIISEAEETIRLLCGLIRSTNKY
jgi:four helix bundle protein